MSLRVKGALKDLIISQDPAVLELALLYREHDNFRLVGSCFFFALKFTLLMTCIGLDPFFVAERTTSGFGPGRV